MGRATVIRAKIEQRIYISIHALRGEGDPISGTVGAITKIFQSTPSVGRATIKQHQCPQQLDISIHALRGEGDQTKSSRFRRWRHFNPRPPWGGRRSGYLGTKRLCLFQSTPSVGRATLPPPLLLVRLTAFQSTPSVGRATEQGEEGSAPPMISIHALRGEGDGDRVDEIIANKNFNPRPPWGGRPFRSGSMEP